MRRTFLASSTHLRLPGFMTSSIYRAAYGTALYHHPFPPPKCKYGRKGNARAAPGSRSLTHQARREFGQDSSRPDSHHELLSRFKGILLSREFVQNCALRHCFRNPELPLIRRSSEVND